MSLNPQISNVYKIAEQLIDEPITSLKIAGAGANSNVFCAQTTTRRLALKTFPARKGDQRNRVQTEWDALTFMRKQGILDVPEPIAKDEVLNAIVFGWIDGDPITKHTKTDLDATLNFVSEVFRISDRAGAQQFGLASEACLSTAEIIRQINGRLEALRPFSKVQDFLEITFLPEYEKCNAVEMDNIELEPSLRRLIPADFGFHNSLKSENGNLGFVDFDYFGWDDPVKMTVDFMIHPAHTLSAEEKTLVKTRLESSLPDDTGFSKRLQKHAPLYALRWALILLNPFRKDRIIEEEIGTPQFDDLIDSRINKARFFCDYARDFSE